MFSSLIFFLSDGHGLEAQPRVKHLETSSHESDYVPSVILLIDVDCFEVQVWQKKLNIELAPEIPCLIANDTGMYVFQYSLFTLLIQYLKEIVNIFLYRIFRITSVNHAAKSRGVSRKGMNLQKAKQKCPDLKIIEIPNRYLKPDARPPRLASYAIADKVKGYFALSTKSCIVQQNSKDEFFIDVTYEVAHRLNNNKGALSKPDLLALPDRTYLLHHKCRIKKNDKSFEYRIQKVLAPSRRPDHREELALVHGAIIANGLIKFLKSETDYQVSAGVGHNKLTAKLACGLSKPAGIAMMPTSAIGRTSKHILISSIPELGGRNGEIIMKEFRIRTMYELAQIPEEQLKKRTQIGKQVLRFRALAQGMDPGRVVEKAMSGEISCGKSFKGTCIPVYATNIFKVVIVKMFVFL